MLLSHSISPTGDHYVRESRFLRAQERKDKIQKYLWNPERGMYFDYNLDKNARSNYEYITTFYPLWAGLATADQAEAVRKNLGVFEHAGGLAMSNRDNRVQWDYPNGWAPTQLLAIEDCAGTVFRTTPTVSPTSFYPPSPTIFVGTAPSTRSTTW